MVTSVPDEIVNRPLDEEVGPVAFDIDKSTNTYPTDQVTHANSGFSSLGETKLDEPKGAQVPKVLYGLATSMPSFDTSALQTKTSTHTRKRDTLKREAEWHTSGASISTRRFHTAAVWFTRVGFVSKSFLYAAMGVLAIIAAVDARNSVSGPQRTFERLRDTLSAVVLAILIVGIFCYSCFGFFFGIFNVDRLPGGVGSALKRFGRCVSACFYISLGINAIQILVNASNPDEEVNNELVAKMFRSAFGRAILALISICFFIVSVVYLFHVFSGKKFMTELATERMGRKRFWVFTTIARIGGLGRVLFFSTFGAIILQAIAQYNNGDTDKADPAILGLEAVLIRVADVSSFYLFLIGSLLFVYAIWAMILAVYRRLPAHQNADQARMAIGLNKSLAAVGLTSVTTGLNKTRSELRTEREVRPHVPTYEECKKGEVDIIEMQELAERGELNHTMAPGEAVQ
eukprot:TRINITY_DN746_c0_g2_i2.p1 TRINITY_DN746_c0_g2~~TRINITY_DN746_c0_g2_i2.p1  ORF type:complete len:459 (+),score=117.16 TRINITY_DN746_c0_g2_i2:153-1529(+)